MSSVYPMPEQPPGTTQTDVMADRQLILIRHADAEIGGTDMQRPLSARGRVDAAAIGRWLAPRASPDLVVTSPALRTVQTWELAVAQLAATPPVSTDHRVYDNKWEDLLAVIRECDAAVVRLAVVGHNPSMQMLVGAHAAFATASIALVDVEGDWAGFDGVQARFREAVVCRG
jgi:phosphohistidine phosphatase